MPIHDAVLGLSDATPPHTFEESAGEQGAGEYRSIQRGRASGDQDYGFADETKMGCGVGNRAVEAAVG